MNIFFVETPMEMVNVIEARHRFPEGPCRLLIHTIYPKGIFRALLKKAEWKGEIHFFRNHEARNWDNSRFSKRRQIRLRLTIDRIVRMAGEADILFLDYIRAHVRHIANKVKHRQLVIIDGGTDTIRVNAMRHLPVQEKVPLANLSFMQSVKGLIREKYFDLDTRTLPSVTFFTAYDIVVPLFDRLIKNDYNYLKQWTSGQQNVDGAYLLGEPLIEDGYVDREIYFSYVDRIKDYIGPDMIYVPHPRESDENVRKISEKFGIQTRRFNRPIEIQILLSGIRPRILASFFSSALINCSLIFGNELAVRSFYIVQRDFSPDHEYVEIIYEYMRQNSTDKFMVIDL